MREPEVPLTLIELRVRNAEIEIASIRTSETAIAFAQNGIEFLRKQGDASQITFSADELEQLKDAIVTHNHPKGTSLLDHDVAFALRRDLAEIRAVGENDAGERYTYVLKRGASGWLHSRDEVWDQLWIIGSKVRRKLERAISRGEISGAEARRHFRHRVMTQAAEEFSWDYRRIPVD